MAALITEPQIPSTAPRAYRPVSGLSLSEDYLLRQFARPSRAPEKITYELTHDAGLIYQYYRLREEMFISVWGLEHFSGQKDAFDDDSDIIVARMGNHCIGGCRLTFSDGNKRLPMEKDDLTIAQCFPELPLGDGITYLEVSRLAILPDYQSGAAMLELTREMFKRAAEKGARFAFAIAPAPLARSYRKTTIAFGGPVWAISKYAVPDREEYEGIKMVLLTMDLAPIYGQQTISTKTSKTDLLPTA